VLLFSLRFRAITSLSAEVLSWFYNRFKQLFTNVDRRLMETGIIRVLEERIAVGCGTAKKMRSVAACYKNLSYKKT
jgi:hypothetical protein